MRFVDSFVSIFFILDNKLIKMTFVEIKPGCHFTLDNLPYGVFSTSHNVSVTDVSEKIWGAWVLYVGQWGSVFHLYPLRVV